MDGTYYQMIVSGWQWISVDFSGCVNVIFVYQLRTVSDQNYLHELIDKVSILEMQAADHKIRSDDLSK